MILKVLWSVDLGENFISVPQNHGSFGLGWISPYCGRITVVLDMGGF
jgi:hypothetical protein